MFKKNNRLSSWLFKPLLKGKTEFSPSFRVKYIKTLKPLRISVVVPKKVIKKRVDRNTLKRKILHYIKDSIDIDHEKDIAFWLTKDVSNTNWKHEIDILVKKMDIKKQ